MTILLHQSPDHTVEVGDPLTMPDGSIQVVTSIKAHREKGCFLDFGRVVRWCVVTVELERADGNPA